MLHLHRNMATPHGLHVYNRWKSEGAASFSNHFDVLDYNYELIKPLIVV